MALRDLRRAARAFVRCVVCGQKGLTAALMSPSFRWLLIAVCPCARCGGDVVVGGDVSSACAA